MMPAFAVAFFGLCVYAFLYGLFMALEGRCVLPPRCKACRGSKS